MKRIIQTFKTKDSEIASLLIATKQILISHYWEDNICFFLFGDANDCEKVINDYRNDKIILSAKTLFEGIRVVKSVIRYK